MDFNFFMPVKLITGTDCVRNNGSALAQLGKKCLIVTGKNSAIESGALDDLVSALESAGIEYSVFDKITQNPMLSTCFEGGALARERNADFIVGIGGGSPLDSAKAIAVFAVNELTPEEIFDCSWKKTPLPIVAIGTTAGTGSEITPFAIMTVDSTGQKRAIRHVDCYMTLAFGDPKYTYSLSREFTISTALDALSHAVEGYFSSTAGDISDLFAIKGIALLFESLSHIHANPDAPISHEMRETLYYASLYAGITLNACGTGYCHPMGYPLTEDHGIPHGRACAVYLPSYIERAQRFLPEKAQILAASIGISLEALKSLIAEINTMKPVHLSEAQRKEYTGRWSKNRNFEISPGGFTQAEAEVLLTSIFAE